MNRKLLSSLLSAATFAGGPATLFALAPAPVPAAHGAGPSHTEFLTFCPHGGGDSAARPSVAVYPGPLATTH